MNGLKITVVTAVYNGEEYIEECIKSIMNQTYKNFEHIIMDKFSEKLSKFSDAIKSLEDALNEYEEYKITSSRDGVIQRFEFCTELAWKSTREYLIAQGYVEINSPKSVMKQAYADGIIDDEQAWLDLLYARNLTSHIYDETTASDIFDDIKDKYLTLFRQLQDKLTQ